MTGVLSTGGKPNNLMLSDVKPVEPEILAQLLITPHDNVLDLERNYIKPKPKSSTLQKKFIEENSNLRHSKIILNNLFLRDTMSTHHSPTKNTEATKMTTQPPLTTHENFTKVSVILRIIFKNQG